jgi:hypothetical protein
MRQPIRLECHTGGSNKFFTIEMVATGGGFLVNTTNGAIGATPTPRTLTPAPVAEAEADKLYDAKLKDKLKGQYSPVNGVVPQMVGPVGGERKQSGLDLQLLRDITEELWFPEGHPYAGFPVHIKDPRWLMMQKMDGQRRAVRCNSKTAIGINRNGEEVPLDSNLERKLVRACRELDFKYDTVLDGEIIGETLWVFDCLEINGADHRQHAFRDRLTLANDFVAACHTVDIQIVPVYRNEGSKWDALRQIQDTGGEGVVFRLATSPYRPGRPGKLGDALKFKFWHDIDCIVGEGRDGKRSVSLWLINGWNGKKELWGYAKVHDNYPLPKLGAVVKIRYLYAVDKLYQPQYEGERDDKRPSECVYNPKGMELGGQKIYFKNNEEKDDAG